MIKICDDCIYFNFIKKCDDVGSYGECRRHSPKFIIDGKGHQYPLFPYISIDCWCGEFKKKDNEND